MPRLIGKTSTAPLYTTIALLVIVGTVTVLEDTGTIDLIPGFGRDNPSMRIPSSPNNR